MRITFHRSEPDARRKPPVACLDFGVLECPGQPSRRVVPPFLCCRLIVPNLEPILRCRTNFTVHGLKQGPSKRLERFKISHFITSQFTCSLTCGLGWIRRSGTGSLYCFRGAFFVPRPPRSCTGSYKRDKFRTFLIKSCCKWDFDPFYPHFIKNAS